MDAPPTAGSRIQHLGDRVVVEFRPVRTGGVAFLVVWLTFWTIGGVTALKHVISGASWGDRPFLLFWLCCWAVGEGGVIVVVAWLLRGRELLIATPERLEVRQQIGRFARTRAFDATRVQTVEAARVPSDEDEGELRTDFCLRVINDDKSVGVGEGLGEQEAEDIAAVVRELIRPRRWWGEEAHATWSFPQLYREAAAKRRQPWKRAFVVFCTALVVTTAIGFLYGSGGGDDTEQSQTTQRRRAASSDTPFLLLASADAHRALVAAGRLPVGVPTCRGNARTRRWVCAARATSANGTLALFRCEGFAQRARCAPAATAARAPRRSGPARVVPTSTRAGDRSASP